MEGWVWWKAISKCKQISMAVAPELFWCVDHLKKLCSTGCPRSRLWEPLIYGLTYFLMAIITFMYLIILAGETLVRYYRVWQAWPLCLPVGPTSEPTDYAEIRPRYYILPQEDSNHTMLTLPKFNFLFWMDFISNETVTIGCLLKNTDQFSQPWTS